jgi:hypothetical protein
MFAQALWMNIPLMVLIFALWVGIPLWLVLRRKDWHGKHDHPTVPAYMARRRVAPIRVSMVRLRRPARPAGYGRRHPVRPLTGDANG